MLLVLRPATAGIGNDGKRQEFICIYLSTFAVNKYMKIRVWLMHVNMISRKKMRLKEKHRIGIIGGRTRNKTGVTIQVVVFCPVKHHSQIFASLVSQQFWDILNSSVICVYCFVWFLLASYHCFFRICFILICYRPNQMDRTR